MVQLLLDITPEWRPTLENFVVGRNLELHTALCRALSVPGGERGFYLWGGTCSGKSHLLQAVVARARELGLDAHYAAAEVPTAAAVVAVDDVERLDEAAQCALFELYNRMREQGGLLLVSGSQAPGRLALRDDLRTRLGWGLVYQLQELSDAEKAEALQRHAAARGLVLPTEVMDYLLRHGRRDFPSLLATLDALDVLCLRQHKPAATVPLLKEAMQVSMGASS